MLPCIGETLRWNMACAVRSVSACKLKAGHEQPLGQIVEQARCIDEIEQEKCALDKDLIEPLPMFASPCSSQASASCSLEMCLFDRKKLQKTHGGPYPDKRMKDPSSFA
jgi:hypothetical protein